jgi:hypothetical protein
MPVPKHFKIKVFIRQDLLAALEAFSELEHRLTASPS